MQESKNIQTNYSINSAAEAVTSVGRAMNNISTAIIFYSNCLYSLIKKQELYFTQTL